MRTQDLVRTALLAALSAALGYAMAPVPNVELISAAVFASGALVGVRRGVLVGAVGEAIYAGFNPYGASPPPLFAAQVLGFAAIGAAGGAARPILRRTRLAGGALCAGAAGALLTLAYDVLTSSAVWLTARESTSWAAMVAGGLSFPFPLAHVLGNTVSFAVVVPAVLGAVWRRSPP